MAQVGTRGPLKNRTNQLQNQVLVSKQDVKKAPVKVCTTYYFVINLAEMTATTI